MSPKRLLHCALTLLLATSLLPHFTKAGLPLGGVTIALSPDGKTLVAGGDSRTLLVMDPQTLEVKSRIWVETSITALDFSKDGSTLLVSDSSDRVLLYKTADWSKKSAFDKRESVSVARAVDLFAAAEKDYQGNIIHFCSASDGSSKGSVKLVKEERVVALGLNPAGTRLAVLCAGKDDAAEKKVEYKDIPKELQGDARTTFQQQNDGKTALVAFVEVPSGKIISQQRIFYTTSSGKIYFNGEQACIVGDSGGSAKVTPDWKVEVFTLPNSGYATGASPDHKLLMTGGMRAVSLTPTDAVSAQNGTLSTLPGWPEYVKGLATNNEGSCYATTSAYRVVKLGRNGGVEKEMPLK